MTFVHIAPWLGAIAVLLCAAVFLGLYLLKPPPQAVIVPSTLVWQRVADQQPRRNRWLRWLVSLLIATATGVFLVLALGGLERANAGGRDLVLIIDNSATMAARRGDGRTRLDHAKAQARARLDSSAAGLYLADTTGDFGLVTLSRTKARERLDRIEVRLARTARLPPLPADLDLERTDVLLFTDGVAKLVPSSAADIETVSALVPARNAGITAFRAVPVPASPDRVEAFLEVANGSATAIEAELRVAPEDGAAILERRLELAAGETWSGLLDLRGIALTPRDSRTPTALVATITADGDALDADDRAFLLPPPTGAIAVGVVSAGSGGSTSRLASTLALDDRLEVTALTAQELATASPRFDVLVFDRWAPDAPPRLPSLLVAPPRRDWLPKIVANGGHVSLGATRLRVGPPAAVIGTLGNRPSVDQESVTGLVLEDLEIQRLTVYDVPPEQILLGDSSSPLLIASPQHAGASGNAKATPPWLLFTFDPERSNLPLHAEYPILLAGLVEHFGPTGPTPQLAPGLHELEPSVRLVRGPTGAVISTVRSPASVLAELERPGIYRLASDSGALSALAVGPLGSAVTFINRSTLTVADPSGATRGRRPPLRSLLIGAALLLGAIEIVTRSQGWTE